MTLTHWSVSLVAVVGLTAAIIAGAAIWLIASDPVSVSNAVSTGDIAPVLQAISAVLVDALKGLFKYL